MLGESVWGGHIVQARAQPPRSARRATVTLATTEQVEVAGTMSSTPSGRDVKRCARRGGRARKIAITPTWGRYAQPSGRAGGGGGSGQPDSRPPWCAEASTRLRVAFAGITKRAPRYSSSPTSSCRTRRRGGADPRRPRDHSADACRAQRGRPGDLSPSLEWGSARPTVVAYVGRIEPHKNQLGLIRELHGTGVELMIVGDEHPHHPEYVARCRREADSKVTFVPGLYPIRAGRDLPPRRRPRPSLLVRDNRPGIARSGGQRLLGGDDVAGIRGRVLRGPRLLLRPRHEGIHQSGRPGGVELADRRTPASACPCSLHVGTRRGGDPRRLSQRPLALTRHDRPCERRLVRGSELRASDVCRVALGRPAVRGGGETCVRSGIEQPEDVLG